MLKSRKYMVLAAAFLVLLIAVGVSMRSASGFSVNKEKVDTQAVSTAQDEIEQEQALLLEKLPQGQNGLKEEKKPLIVSYTVKSGDTLGVIASENGTSISAIAASNGISENSMLKEGQVLRFPSVKGVLYKIKEDETLWDISFANDVAVEDIVKANNMDSPDKLRIGQEIILPGVDKIKTVVASDAKLETNSSKVSNTQNSKTAAAKSAGIKVASRGGQAITASGSSSTAMIWPLQGRITSGYGPRGAEFHKGIDIAAPVGTDLKAALAGIVTYSGWMNGYGNFVVISHGDGLETYYGHNSENLVSVGDHVEKGQVIAKLGNTGRSTGPHVEFGVRKNGSPVNPLTYLK